MAPSGPPACSHSSITTSHPTPMMQPKASVKYSVARITRRSGDGVAESIADVLGSMSMILVEPLAGVPLNLLFQSRCQARPAYSMDGAGDQYFAGSWLLDSSG